MLGLRPGEFWELTAYEMALMLEAAGNRELRERRFAAAMTANLMNCWRVKNSPAVTVDLLLGIPKPGEQPSADAGRRRMAWLSKPLDQMTPAQRKRLQKHLAEQREKRAAAAKS